MQKSSERKTRRPWPTVQQLTASVAAEAAAAAGADVPHHHRRVGQGAVANDCATIEASGVWCEVFPGFLSVALARTRTWWSSPSLRCRGDDGGNC